MIDLKTLKEIGKLKGLANVGYMEKDYFQEILLLIIYRNFNFLVFKGGTCLYKFHKLGRFSEDLDFSAVKEFDLDNFLSVLKNGLEKFNLQTHNVSCKKTRSSLLIKLRINGLLPHLSTLRIDINVKSEVNFTQTLNLKPMYPDIPSFDVLVMAEKEILAEKVRAVMTRTKARDVYDIWFLLEKGIDVDLGLFKQKMEYYNKKFSVGAFNKHLRLKREIWMRELGPLIEKVPSFSKVNKKIRESVGNLYK